MTEEKNPARNTVSESREENKPTDGSRPSKTTSIEGIGALTAVVASFSLAMSFAYDWGFFSGVGVSFADAPTTLSDHLHTWLYLASDTRTGSAPCFGAGGILSPFCEQNGGGRDRSI